MCAAWYVGFLALAARFEVCVKIFIGDFIRFQLIDLLVEKSEFVELPFDLLLNFDQCASRGYKDLHPEASYGNLLGLGDELSGGDDIHPLELVMSEEGSNDIGTLFIPLNLFAKFPCIVLDSFE